MSGGRERIRSLYEEGPAYWPQADALAAALGLRREDVLTGEDLARRMDGFVRETDEEGLIDSRDVWTLVLMDEDSSWFCPAFSLAAWRYLLSPDERRAGRLVAVTGEVVTFEPEERRFRARGAIALEGRFRETLQRAAAALREEGHSPRLVERIEAWLSEGEAPSLGQNLARLTGDASLVDAVDRGDVSSILASLSAWPGLLDRPREVWRAIGDERRVEGWLGRELSEIFSQVWRFAGPIPSLARPLEVAEALLGLSSPDRPDRPRMTLLRRQVEACLEPGRLPEADRALRRLEQSDERSWPPPELFALRSLAAGRMTELADGLTREGDAARAVAAFLSSVEAFAEGDDSRALALAREALPGEIGAEQQRNSLLAEVREALGALLGLPAEDE